MSAIENHKIFIYLSLYFTGALNKSAFDVDRCFQQWNSITANHQAFYEIYERFEVKENERFVMKPGFTNFQSIDRNQILASLDGQDINAKEKSIIFMPLYQVQGSDGFFLIRPIPRFFLWLSRHVRTFKLDRFFVFLPGVKWSSEAKDTMLVDLRIARFFLSSCFIFSDTEADK